MLELALREVRRLGMEVDARVMDAESLQQPDDSFDTVVSAFAVCTFPHPMEALGEMRRVCRPNGRVLLLGHGLSDRSLVARLQNLRANLQIAKRGCHGNRDVISLASASGLEVVGVRRSWFGIFHELECRPRRG